MRKNNQSGFSALEIIIVVAVVAIIGYLGYTFYTNYQNRETERAAVSTADSLTAPTINSNADLDKASQAMDETNFESASTDDLSDLENDMSNF